MCLLRRWASPPSRWSRPRRSPVPVPLNPPAGYAATEANEAGPVFARGTRTGVPTGREWDQHPESFARCG